MTQTTGIHGTLGTHHAVGRKLRATVAVLLVSWGIAAVVHPTGIPLASSDSDANSAPAFVAPHGDRGEIAPSVTTARSSSVSTESSRYSTTGPLAEESAGQACQSGMIEVAADYCPVVEQVCLRYLGSESHDRCAEFHSASRCIGASTPKHFCIDEFEYPNLPGSIPLVSVTWNGAQELCEAAGKRLCTDSEWTLACEGEERSPYPYGRERDSRACNIDQSYIVPDDDAYANPITRDRESARLSRAETSGARAECVSSFGVHDLTGNVDEWVTNEHGSPERRPYTSGLKGGYWGPVRNRCRPMTVDHNQWHIGYQIGFRCCADTPGEGPSEGSGSDPQSGDSNGTASATPPM